MSRFKDETEIEPKIARRPPRLFVEATLSDGLKVSFGARQAHYLRNVMRLRDGDGVLLFNGRDGEWLARLDGGRKSEAIVETGVRRQQETAGPWLIYAPLKKDANDYLIQKAVELGCSRLQPVITERAQARPARVDRYGLQAIEAAEQCERLDVPDVEPPVSLEALAADWPTERRLFVAVERDSAALAPVPAFQAHHGSPAGFLVGPEGGLSGRDLDRLAPASPVFVHLGPRILRAETAAAALLTLWQGVVGDWTEPAPAPVPLSSSL